MYTTCICKFSIMLVFMVTKTRATIEEETINRAPVSLAEHSWKFRAVNIPIDMHSFSVQAEKQEETSFCSLKGQKIKTVRKKNFKLPKC